MGCHWELFRKPQQTGASSSLDLKEVGQRCDSIHWRSISSEWIRSLSHSLSGGRVARPAKCERLLLCSARKLKFRVSLWRPEVGCDPPAGGLRCAVGFRGCAKLWWRRGVYRGQRVGSKNKACGESKEKTLTPLLQRGESSSLLLTPTDSPKLPLQAQPINYLG